MDKPNLLIVKGTMDLISASRGHLGTGRLVVGRRCPSVSRRLTLAFGWAGAGMTLP